ncbi:MAG: HAMP domain-containing histidine kinase [Candidatus Omnitrophica bacterium]|nr:HAMP domain-containing histidine kinase [Candidatus Omnitrophota bacterium]
MNTRLLIIGGDERVVNLLKALRELRGIKLEGLCDKREDSPGMNYARKIALDTYTDFKTCISEKRPDIIINTSGCKKFQKALKDLKKRDIKIIDLKTAGLLLDIASEEIRSKKEVDKMKTEFISATSHELRTPLTAIKESVMLVLDGTAGKVSPQQIRFLNITRKNINRLAELINNLLDISKIESGRLKLKKELCSISGLVIYTVRSMKPLVRENRLKLKLDIPKALPKVYCDHDRVEQVLLNFVDNAAKYTPAGGNINIKASELVVKKKRFMQISVRDTGIGIAKKDIPKLFIRFEQLDKSLTRRPGGAGLGLAICRKLIEMHGGRVWVDSRPGGGSIFSFTLPVDGRK